MNELVLDTTEDCRSRVQLRAPEVTVSVRGTGQGTVGYRQPAVRGNERG